jgi:hypothetical protein
VAIHRNNIVGYGRPWRENESPARTISVPRALVAHDHPEPPGSRSAQAGSENAPGTAPRHQGCSTLNHDAHSEELEGVEEKIACGLLVAGDDRTKLLDLGEFSIR